MVQKCAYLFGKVVGNWIDRLSGEKEEDMGVGRWHKWVRNVSELPTLSVVSPAGSTSE